MAPPNNLRQYHLIRDYNKKNHYRRDGSTTYALCGSRPQRATGRSKNTKNERSAEFWYFNHVMDEREITTWLL